MVLRVFLPAGQKKLSVLGGAHLVALFLTTPTNKNARPTTRSPVVHMKKNMADYCDEDYEGNEEECEEEFDEEEEEASYTSDLY